MKTPGAKRGKETRMKDSAIDQGVWDGKSKNMRSREKASLVFRLRATISARVDLGYLLKSARSRGGPWMRREASFPQLTQLLPLYPLLPGELRPPGPPGTPRRLSYAYGSAARGPQKTKRYYIDCEESLIYQKGTSVASLRRVIAFGRNN